MMQKKSYIDFIWRKETNKYKFVRREVRMELKILEHNLTVVMEFSCYRLRQSKRMSIIWYLSNEWKMSIMSGSITI